MTVFPIILIALSVLLLILGFVFDSEDLGITGLYTFLIFLIYLCTLSRTTPEAIDVYRGKTTLEITYRDSIPIDSTVVYKK